MNLSFLKKIKKQHFAVFLLLIFTGLILPHQVFGSTGSRIAEGVLWIPLQILRGFLLLIEFGHMVVLGMAGSFLDMAITLSMNNIASAKIVTVGSAIVRDVANMFFIVVLLIMAFATILRIPGYGAKENLHKLIIGALLINFSVVIVTPLIDFSQVLVKYFSAAIPGGFSAGLKTGMNFAGFWAPNASWLDSTIAAVKSVLWVSFPDIITHFLTIALLEIAIFVFAAGAFFLLVRIITLWALLIFSPIIWVAWALPATKKYWDEWWASFLKSVMFAPVYVFMLYLTIIVINSEMLAEMSSQGSLATVDPEISNWMTTAFLGNPNGIMAYFLLMGLLIMSLIVAKNAGVMGAGAAMGFGKSLGKKTSGWIGGKSRSAFGTGTAITLGLAGRQAGENRRAAGTRRMNTIIRTIERAPLIGRAIGGPGAQRERQRTEMDEAKKNYKQRDTGDLLQMMRQPVITVSQMQQRSAILELLAERNALGQTQMQTAGVDTTQPDQVRTMLQTAEALGARMDDVLKVRVDWAGYVGDQNLSADQRIQNQITGTKVSDASRIHQESFDNTVVAQAIGDSFSAKHYDNIASNNTPSRNAVQNQVINNNYITDVATRDYFKNPNVQNNTGYQPHASW